MGLFFRKAPKTPSDALPKKEAQKISRILFSKSPESDPQKRVLLSLAAPMRAKSQNAADCLPSFSENKGRCPSMRDAIRICLKRDRH